jgi:threonine dehydrogenase-like Zn-dependent dehydrogenase
MKAVVFHGIGDIRLDDVAEPKIRDSRDAVIRITASAICGTDLHMVRGTMGDMKPGTILGHEGVGIVEQVGREVRSIKPGDRVVVASTIACGSCSYCRCGYYAQCDGSNPNGPLAGGAFFGGPKDSGAFDGLQAERARIPFANVGCVKIPDEVRDDQALLCSDIFPTAYFGATIAEIQEGNTVAIFGCGPVGLLAIASAGFLGAGRVIAVDTIPSRLDIARDLGAEVINFNDDDPVEAIRSLTGGIGVDRAIDAVGVDAVHPRRSRKEARKFQKEVEEIAPKTNPQGDNWNPGDAPSQALLWSVDALAKAGTLSIIGVYPETATSFPIGKAMGKNLAINMGSCHHRRYIPKLLRLIRNGSVDPAAILTHHEPLAGAIEAYKAFDRREPGWVKVELEPAMAAHT